MKTTTFQNIAVFILFFSFYTGLRAQKILNTTGISNSINTEDYRLIYSLGEMATQTIPGPNGYVTQGLLQPIFSLIPSGPLVTLPLPRAVCLGESVEVAFSSVLKFERDNEFTLELSEDEGGFAQPIVIGKLGGTEVKKIQVSIPADLDPAKNYFMRVTSSNPKADGRVTNLLVRIKPKVSFAINNIACTGDTILATFTGSDTLSNTNYRWDFTDGLWQKNRARYQQGITWHIPGEKKVSLIADNNGCRSDPAIQTVKVERRIAKPKITCAKQTGNSVTFSWSQVGDAKNYEVKGPDNYQDVQKGSYSQTYNNLAPQTRVFLEVRAYGDGPCGFSMDTLTCSTLICPVFSASLTRDVSNACAGELVKADLTLASTSNQRGEYYLVYAGKDATRDTLKLQPGEKPVFAPEENTTYSILSVGNASYPGCFTPIGSLSFKVNVTPNNKPGSAMPIPVVCDSETSFVVLNDLLDGESSNGIWEAFPAPRTGTFDPIDGLFMPKGNAAGRYRFVYSVPGINGCLSRSTDIEMRVEHQATVKIKDYSNCLELTGKTVIDLKTVARIAHPAAPNLVRWYRNETLTDTVLQEKIELSAPLTLYTVIGQGKCASPVSAITLKPGEELPVPKIEGDFEYMVGESLNIRTSSSYPPGSIFTWRAPDTIVSGTDLYLFPARLTTKFSEGRYTLHVRGPQEPGKPTCESKTAWQNIVVFTQDEPPLLIGKNVSDNLPWTIEGLEAFPNHKITVLNRWGEKVFAITGGYTNNWHGTFKDKKLPQGTYYYQIDTGETGKKPILGSLYVIR